MSSAAVNNTPARGAGPRGGALPSTAASAIGSLFGIDAGSTLASFADQLARAGTPVGSTTAADAALLGSEAAHAGNAAAELALANTPAAVGSSAEPPTGTLGHWVAEWLSGKDSKGEGAAGDSVLPSPAMAVADDVSTTIGWRPATAPLLTAGLPAASTAAASSMLRGLDAIRQAGLGMTASCAAHHAASPEPAAPARLAASGSLDAAGSAALNTAASPTPDASMDAVHSLQPDLDGSADTAIGIGTSIGEDTPPASAGNDTPTTTVGAQPPETTPVTATRGPATHPALSAPGAEHRSATANAVLQARFGAEDRTLRGHAPATPASPHDGHPGRGRSAEARAAREAKDIDQASDQAKGSRPVPAAEESTAPRATDAESISRPKGKHAAEESEVPAAGASPPAIVQPLPVVTPEAAARSGAPAMEAAAGEHSPGSVTSAERRNATAAPSADRDGTWPAAQESATQAMPGAEATEAAASSLPSAPPAADRSDRSGDDMPRVATGGQASAASSSAGDAASVSTTLNASALQGDTASEALRASEPLPTFTMAPMPQPGTAPAVQSAAEVPFATLFGAPEFQAEFGAQISLLARDGVEQAELRLNPVEMGPVSVRISIDGDRAQIDFGADSAATRALIEAGMPELASALREAGLTLAGGGVGEHARGQAEGRQAGGDASPHERQRDGQPGGHGNRPANDGEKPAQPARRTVAGDGRLDLYA